MHLMNTKKVRGIPRLSGEPKPISGKCMKRKQTKNSHKKEKEIRTVKHLDLLHMDLMGPMRTESRDGKKYVLIVVDDFKRYSVVSFLREKLEAIEQLKSLFNRIKVEISHLIVRIRNDMGENLTM